MAMAVEQAAVWVASPAAARAWSWRMLAAAAGAGAAVTAAAVATTTDSATLSCAGTRDGAADAAELCAAARRGDARAVNRLLDGGADPNCRHRDGWAALHCAAINRQAEVCRVLLAAGADPNLADEYNPRGAQNMTECVPPAVRRSVPS